MTDEMIVDWAARDQAVLDELEPECGDLVDSEMECPKQGWFNIKLNNMWIGRVNFCQENGWLVSTINIEVKDEYRFKKDVHARGEYQPRYSMFLMQMFFDHFKDYKIREGNGVNSKEGEELIARVRGEMQLPYHQPSCYWPHDGGDCICGLG